MLLRFYVQNFLSFSEEVEFSMVSGPSKQLNSHREHIDKVDLNVLRTGVIYGANGSGKSNLIKALKFGKDLITRGTKADAFISINQFKLDANFRGQASKFEYEFSIDGKVFSYGMKLDQKEIKEEWLVEILKTTERSIFERNTLKDGTVEVTFEKYPFKDVEDKQFLHFVAKGTRPNQLFLTEANDRNVDYLKQFFNWFSSKLVFIFPDNRYDGIRMALDEKKDGIEGVFTKFLDIFDTGIQGLVTKETSIESELPDIPEFIKEDMLSRLKENESVFLQGPSDKCYSICKDASTGELKAKKLMTKHNVLNSDKEILFEVKEESDGTQRIMDFIPALMSLLEGNVSIFIDEIDRSLHPSLTKSIFKIFHSMTSKNGQLIVTTHESSLLDLEILRRDEIWFVEKDQKGSTKAYSLEEFKPRHDKDIRKGYLRGRFGAIPFLNDLDLGWNEA